jgi:hypothetical protein
VLCVSLSKTFDPYFVVETNTALLSLTDYVAHVINLGTAHAFNQLTSTVIFVSTSKSINEIFAVVWASDHPVDSYLVFFRQLVTQFESSATLVLFGTTIAMYVKDRIRTQQQPFTLKPLDELIAVVVAGTCVLLLTVRKKRTPIQFDNVTSISSHTFDLPTKAFHTNG